MPGAGGIKAANYLANIAAHDGTVVHAIMTNMMASQAIGLHGIEFDTRKFSWIGNTTSTPNVINSWHTSGITKIEQVKAQELIVGAPKGTAGVIYPTLLNKLAGMKFKIVTGYPGGNEVNIAMERGEVLGRGSNSWASWKSTKPDWLKDKKIIMLVQVALKRAPDLPDVPLLLELVEQRRRPQADDVRLGGNRDLARARDRRRRFRRIACRRCAAPSTKPSRTRRCWPKPRRRKMDIQPMTGEEAQEIADFDRQYAARSHRARQGSSSAIC